MLLCDAAIINFKMCVEKIEGIVKEKPMATKKKILYIVEAMGGGVFTYIVDLANELVDTYDMYIAYQIIFEKWAGKHNGIYFNGVFCSNNNTNAW